MATEHTEDMEDTAADMARAWFITEAIATDTGATDMDTGATDMDTEATDMDMVADMAMVEDMAGDTDMAAAITVKLAQLSSPMDSALNSTVSSFCK